MKGNKNLEMSAIAAKYCYSRRLNSKETELFMRGVNFVLDSVNLEKEGMSKRLKELEDKYLNLISVRMAVSISDMLGRRRFSRAVNGKMMYAWFLMEEGIPWPIVADIVGRDRSSMHYYDKKKSSLSFDPMMKQMYEEIKKQVNGSNIHIHTTEPVQQAI